MQHAFLIEAHNNWWQLKQLIAALDAENHDVYVHIDKKSVDFDKADFSSVAHKSNVSFFQTYSVYWGGYSQVQVELLLFEEAHKRKYDYYHMISGGDLPLKSNVDFDSFFEDNAGFQFIQYDDEALANNPEIRRRTKLYHFLQNYRRRYKIKWKNDFFTFCERVSLVIQIMFGVNRVKNLDWDIKYGSNWVSITDELVSALLSQKEKIEHIFSFTNCADELFVQTVAYNCGFQEKIYSPLQGQNQSLRYVDWKRGKNGNPYTFHVEDYEMLMRQDALFARKFSESVDKKIIEKILESRG